MIRSAPTILSDELFLAFDPVDLQSISTLYYSVLNRDPDLEGLAYWADAHQNQGVSFEDMRGHFVASAEHVALVGQPTIVYDMPTFIIDGGA